jgi:hypothetical protein
LILLNSFFSNQLTMNMHQAKINPLTPEMLQNSNTDLHDLHIIDQLEARDPSSARWRTRDDMVLCGHWEGEKRAGTARSLLPFPHVPKKNPVIPSASEESPAV